MAVAGYSGTPLIKKLGIKEDTKVLLLNAPADYFQLLGHPLTGQLCGRAKHPTWCISSPPTGRNTNPCYVR